MDAKLRALLDDIEQAIGGMSPEAMDRSPEGKWCVREILEHLSRTYGSTARGLNRAISEGKPVRRPTMSAGRRRRAADPAELDRHGSRDRARRRKTRTQARRCSPDHRAADCTGLEELPQRSHAASPEADCGVEEVAVRIGPGRFPKGLTHEPVR